MLELGDDSTAEHDAIGRLAVRLNISRLVVVGDTARPMASGAQHEGSWGDEAVLGAGRRRRLRSAGRELRPGDVVLFKSSRDAGLRWLGDSLAGRRRSQQRGGHDVKAVLLAAVISLVGALFGTPLFIKFLVRARLRPVHPRRRPDLAPHQARHAHHGRRGHHRRQPRATRSRTLLTGSPLTLSGVLVLFLMTGLGLVGSSTTTSRSPSSAASACGAEASSPARPWSRRLRGAGAAVPQQQDRTPGSTHISFVRDTGFDLAFAGTLLGLILFIIWAY